MQKRWMIIGYGTAALAAAVFGLTRLAHQTNPLSTSRGALSVPSTESSNMDVVLAQPIETSVFIDPIRFDAAWTALKPPPVPQGRVIAGVVNHHVLASDILARFFRTLRLNRPDAKRFIIISPDHYGAGRADISTHERPYRVADRMVLIDTTATKQLVTDGLVAIENGGMYEREHGVGALVPFLLHEFPEATVVPLSIRGISDRAKARELGKRLVTLVDDETLIIISSDMSHYLDETTALTNDESTISWMKRLDSEKFAKANDDYLDNGAAMVALISYFELRDATPSWTLLDHSISSRYGGPKNNTTSYINGVWAEKLRTPF